ncbi:outer membrane usher protein [Escherichia coli]|nr:outer membrane usher protein [Escherichia coli]
MAVGLGRDLNESGTVSADVTQSVARIPGTETKLGKSRPFYTSPSPRYRHKPRRPSSLLKLNNTTPNMTINKPSF